MITPRYDKSQPTAILRRLTLLDRRAILAFIAVINAEAAVTQREDERENPGAPRRNVGFIGLGDQGAPMACAIATSGFPLFVWARRPEAYAELAGSPHVVCGTAAELGKQCAVVGLCVLDDQGVEEVLFARGLIANMTPGSIVTIHSTGAPAAAAQFAQRARRSRVMVLDAPVSGGREAARTRKLSVIVGGDEEAFGRACAVFESYASKIFYVGGSGTAQLAKLLNTLVCNANMRNVADAVITANALNLDVAALLEVLQSGTASSWATGFYAKFAATANVSHLDRVVTKDLRLLASILRAKDIQPSPTELSADKSIVGLSQAQSLL
jgi:3-hydroxyisobutyrate dehydrogenase-like beta-hydroxyacid dehydrogenase